MPKPLKLVIFYDGEPHEILEDMRDVDLSTETGRDHLFFNVNYVVHNLLAFEAVTEDVHCQFGGCEHAAEKNLIYCREHITGVPA
jgi:hypothetical protein